MQAKLRKMLKQESCGFPWRARNNFYELFKSSVSHMNVWMRSWPVSPHVQDCQFKCLFLRCRPQNVVHWTSWWKLYWETIAGIHRNAGAIKLAPAVKNIKTSLAAAFHWCKSFSKCSRSPRSSMSDHLLGCINRLSSKRCSHKLSDISVFPGLPSGVSCVRDNGSSKTAGHYMTDCLCHNLHVVWDHHLKELFLLLASVANTQVATKVNFPPLRKETTKWKIKRLPVLESLLIFFCRLDTNEFYLHLFVFDSFQMLFSSKDKSFGFILNILLCGQPQQFSWLYVSILWYFVHYSNLQSEKKNLESQTDLWPLPAGQSVDTSLCSSGPPPEPVACDVPCSRDCVLSDWTPWSTCSQTCSSKNVEGKQMRTRSILAYNAGEGEMTWRERMQPVFSRLNWAASLLGTFRCNCDHLSCFKSQFSLICISGFQLIQTVSLGDFFGWGSICPHSHSNGGGLDHCDGG